MWLDPDKLLGPLLFPIVSLSVALILFEGSLTLRFHELSGIGHVVRGLVSYGAIVALLLLAVAAHYLAGMGWDIALLFGALTCVTGPTVIVPMLRTLRPECAHRQHVALGKASSSIHSALCLRVLIYEAIVSRHQGHAIGIFLSTVLTGAVAGGLPLRCSRFCCDDN